jgi:hypothetical protein
LSTDEYCNLLADETLREFSEYFFTIFVEEELDLRLSYLSETDSSIDKIFVIENLAINGLGCLPETRSLIDEYI